MIELAEGSYHASIKHKEDVKRGVYYRHLYWFNEWLKHTEIALMELEEKLKKIK